MDLKNSVVLVTGSARGIGYAIAEHCARQGARIVLSDVLEAEVKAAGETLARETGVEVLAVACDVTQEASVAALYAAVNQRFGGVDVAVLNAGIIKDRLLIKKDKETGVIGYGMGLDDWNKVIAVNLTGVFLTGREAAKAMAAKGKGCIVTISSIAKHGNVGQSNYSATKAGVEALTVTWSKELARFGVRVNGIAPGFIGTPMVLQTMNQEAREKMEKLILVGRIGSPTEIARTVQFIVENDFLDGEMIEVTGGMRI
jgi:3-oxoacyl-[acyl-carrier protein] reductase